MFTAILIIAIACIVLELSIVAKVKALREFIIRHPVVGIVFSILLTWFIGFLFAVTGTTVMGAAVISTAITGMVYGFFALLDRAIEWWRNRKEPTPTVTSQQPA